MRKRITALAVVVALLCVLPSGALASDAEGQAGTWDISKSKEATNLDGNFESTVTLSLPSAQERLSTDVVFVLDKSTSNKVEQQAISMLEAVKEQAEKVNATVKVGVVIFNKEAHVEKTLTDLVQNFDEIKSAIEAGYSSGTNLHAGLMAGKALLDGDTDTDACRKYLITVSDGITYIFNDDSGEAASIVTEQFEHNAGEVKSVPNMTMTGAAMKYQYFTDIFGEEGVKSYLERIGALVEKDAQKYWVKYGSDAAAAPYTLKSNVNEAGAKTLDDETFAKYVGDDSVNDHANNVDTALYLSYKIYTECVEAGYNCSAMLATENKDNESRYPWASRFMNYLADGQTVTFDKIQNEILYLLDAGSVVEDEIGKTEEYDFNLIRPENMIVKVGDKEYKAAAKTGEMNTFTFGEADENGQFPYEVSYFPEDDNNTREYLRWQINVPVSNLERTSLSYTVKLKEHNTQPGTYGIYDRYGENKYSGLYTNNSAVLYPVDSGGNQGTPEEFLKPTVSYTVSKPYIPPVTHYYTVIYNDGVEGEVVFPDQINRGLTYWTLTPDFNGVPVRDGYEFRGWTPVVAERVTEDAYYQAVWEKSEEPVQPTDPIQPEKPAKPEKPTGPEEPSETCETETEVPKTGDTAAGNMLLTLFMLTLSVLGGIVFRFRKSDRS